MSGPRFNTGGFTPPAPPPSAIDPVDHDTMPDSIELWRKDGWVPVLIQSTYTPELCDILASGFANRFQKALDSHGIGKIVSTRNAPPFQMFFFLRQDRFEDALPLFFKLLIEENLFHLLKISIAESGNAWRVVSLPPTPANPS